jgi:genome maintenance exonuclease 1
MYIHLPPVEISPIVQENRPNGRVYHTVDGKVYPSVTTVLGFGSNPWLDDWVRKVGPEEAKIISARAAARGTRIHALCEDVLFNRTAEPSVFDKEMFQTMLKALPRINNIRCVEQRLYSDILRVAGTVDLIADFDDIPSIIDWKTSRRLKRRDEIGNYFAQCGAYALAYEERTGVKIPNIVIVMGVDDEPEPLIFIEKAKDWIPEFIKQRKIFRLGMGF